MRDGADAWPGRLGPALVWGVTLALFAALFALQNWARWQAAPATILGRIGMFAACHGLGGAVAGALAAGLFGIVAAHLWRHSGAPA